LWEALGHNGSVCDAQWPSFNEDYLKEEVVTYAISFNGKTRFTIDFPAETDKAEIEKIALAAEGSVKYMEGKPAKKIIVVPNKVVNIVF